MNVLKSVMHWQSCCLADKTNCLLTSLSSLPNRDYGSNFSIRDLNLQSRTEVLRQVCLGNTFSNTLNKRSQAT